MFLIENRLTAVLAALATAAGLALWSTRNAPPSDDSSSDGRPVTTVSRAATADPSQQPSTRQSLLASRSVASSVLSQRN
jgi:hypothetical protein